MRQESWQSQAKRPLQLSGLRYFVEVWQIKNNSCYIVLVTIEAFVGGFWFGGIR
jgi:hypothetical protein